MTFKFICIGFSILIIVFPVVNSSRIERGHTTPDIIEIANNISGVQSLLQKMLKNFKDLEKIAISDSVETNDETDSENKENIDTNTNNKSKIDPKITIRNKQAYFKGTPIYFSDRSSEKDDSETEEKETTVVTKTNGHTRITAKALKKSTPARHYISLETHNQMKARTSDEETESSGDVVSSNETLRIDPQTTAKPGKDIVKNFDIHLGKAKGEVKIHSSTVKQKHLSITTPKISKPAEVVHDSQSKEDKVMEGEVMRAGYLRQAYDDACKQVVIRKCFRALRDVSKDVCSRSKKCSSQFKDAFRANGQAACDQQFNDQTSACRMGVDLDEADADSLQSERLRATDIKNKKSPKTSDIQEVHILRDKFEQICKKNSYDKCQEACKDASDKTCKIHECIKAKTKALKRCCKRRCQDSFRYFDGSSDESEERDDDDGDSDDDDDDDDKDKDKDKDKNKYRNKDKDNSD